ncbi:C3HC zinc finger-like-domain-containing protein [Podospora didyma]|uniref:C3HC zinc finger-like-domain-containing protein n=1 Tax=Podospora didyma TaxID=330526 RepID=A0AAE0P7R5_9PEZI|nr:C3HC zinc finger-like-domain-containing protein [Podospora didyma]
MNAAVKRKFNALLQGIGNRPQQEPSSSADASAPPNDGSRPSSSRDGSLLDKSRPATATSSSSKKKMAYDNLEILAKKRRVGGSGLTTTTTPTKQDTAAGLLPARSATTTISNITLRKWTPTGGVAGGRNPSSAWVAAAPAATPTKDKGPPKYCPGDREQLLRRLATFQEITDWTPKPDRVNEVEWAKRGWVCQGKERVQCTLCSRDLVVKLNRKEVDGKEIPVLIASEIAESVVDKYAELIVESHAEDCLWRKKGCDDSLLRVPLPNAQQALQDLRQRYDELCERKDFLPYEFNLRLPQGLDVNTILSYLPPNFFTEPPPAKAAAPSTTTPRPHPNRTAIALAVLGWAGLSNPRIGGAVPNSASCHTCLRRLGLWMFKSKQVDPETNTVLVPAPMDHLDPLREHRFFCAWKNGAAQRNPGAKPLAPDETEKAGWEVLVQLLRNEAFIRQRVGVAHSRSKSTVPTTGTPKILKTPERSGTSAARPRGATLATVHGQARGATDEGHEDDDEEVEAGYEDTEEGRKKKDQAMMSRLRRVKSLFNTKGSKLKRLGSSRPGTSHSNAGGG